MEQIIKNRLDSLQSSWSRKSYQESHHTRCYTHYIHMPMKVCEFMQLHLFVGRSGVAKPDNLDSLPK